jgi:uncharacterized protein YfaQ (DUF2300 family)
MDAHDSTWKPFSTPAGATTRPPGDRLREPSGPTWRLDRDHVASEAQATVVELLDELELAPAERERAFAVLVDSFVRGVDCGWRSAMGEATRARSGVHVDVREYAHTLNAVAGAVRT